MGLMNEEDAIYATLLTQLLSDSDTGILDDRVNSWIERQYNFVFSENKIDDNHTVHGSDTRAPSPSPSSSVGAHRSFDFDHLDVSTSLPLSYTEPHSFQDAVWFSPTSPPYALAEEEEHEDDHVHSLDSLKKEMTHMKVQSTPPPSNNKLDKDKDLPAPPPSPAFSLKKAVSSRTLRSRSSSGRMSRLSSLTTTLSSHQSQTQDAHPPLPDRASHSLSNVGSRKRSASFPRKFLRVQEDRDSPHPSPTVSDFSIAYSRETTLTTPFSSTPGSPTSPTFISTPCLPENIALPASPLDQQGFFREQTLHGDNERSRSSLASPFLPKHSIPVSPSTTSLVSAAINLSSTSRAPPTTNASSEREVGQRHRTEYSQSQWSVTTESSQKPPPSEPKLALFSTSRILATGEKDKEQTTPKRKTRLLSLISHLSPGRSNASSTTIADRKTGPHSVAVVGEGACEVKPARKRAFGRGSPSKKASLASIRTSFTLSRTSFGSSRPSISSPAKEGSLPNLPTSPIRTSHSASRPSLTDGHVTPLSKKSSLASLRASFSLSRTSFSSLVSPTEEVPPLPTSPGHAKTSFSASRPSLSDGAVPTLCNQTSLASLSASASLARASPLPTSPTRTSFSMSRPSFIEGSVTSEAVTPVPKVSLPKAPSRVAQIDTTLPLPLSKINSPSQVSFSETVATSTSASQASLLSSTTTRTTAGSTSIPMPSRRVSLASAAGIKQSVFTNSMPGCDTQIIPTKPILRLTAKPSGPRTPTLSASHLERKVTSPRIPVLGKTHLPSPGSVGKVPQPPTKFTPPAKLASVLEARSERLAPAVFSSISVSAQPTRTSQIPTPLRYMPKGRVTPPAIMVENALPGRSRKLPVPLDPCQKPLEPRPERRIV